MDDKLLNSTTDDELVAVVTTDRTVPSLLVSNVDDVDDASYITMTVSKERDTNNPVVAGKHSIY